MCRVGGILARHWKTWEALNPPPQVLQIIREGYLLPIISHVPLTLTPSTVPHRNNDVVSDLVAEMAAKGIVEEAPSPLNPGFYSTIFAVPKSSGGHRLVINLKVLNQHLRTPSFSMETTSSVIACLQGSRWTATIDLQDA